MSDSANLNAGDGGTAAITGNGAGSVGESAKPAAPAWASQLPDDLKGNEQLTQFAKLGDLGKAYLDLNGKLASAITIPGEGATEEQVKEFRQKLGIPDSPRNYALKGMEGVPKVGGENDQSAEWFAERALEANLSKSQAQKLYKSFMIKAAEDQATLAKARTEAENEAETKLRAEFKDRYEPLVKRIDGILAMHGGEDLVKKLDVAGMLKDPDMRRFMAKIAAAVGEDVLPSGAANPSQQASARSGRLADAVNFDFPESSKSFPKKR